MPHSPDPPTRPARPTLAQRCQLADDFTPVHVERTGAFRVNQPLAQAFALFLREGGAALGGDGIPVLHPRGVPSDLRAPSSRRITTRGDEWLVLRYSAADGSAEYVRISRGSRMGLVTVRATERGGATEVEDDVPSNEPFEAGSGRWRR